MKVLMVGATGKYASLVVPELKQLGVTVRALVRNESKSVAARQQGAEETVIADLNNPVKSSRCGEWRRRCVSHQSCLCTE